jgi:MtN3 and saliva related transmembrane protein
MNLITIIGLIAAICTTISFIPQVIKVVKTRGTKDISLLMYIIMTTGLLLWLIYGLMICNWPIILANAISSILAIIVLIFKIKQK